VGAVEAPMAAKIWAGGGLIAFRGPVEIVFFEASPMDERFMRARLPIWAGPVYTRWASTVEDDVRLVTEHVD
jgi:hypothetical protein